MAAPPNILQTNGLLQDLFGVKKHNLHCKIDPDGVILVGMARTCSKCVGLVRTRTERISSHLTH
jgi:hypothetical protein